MTFMDIDFMNQLLDEGSGISITGKNEIVRLNVGGGIFEVTYYNYN